MGDIPIKATSRTVTVPSAAKENVGRIGDADSARAEACSPRPAGPPNPPFTMM